MISLKDIEVTKEKNLHDESYDSLIERIRKVLDLLIDPGVTINNARFQELVSECRKINEMLENVRFKVVKS